MSRSKRRRQQSKGRNKVWGIYNSHWWDDEPAGSYLPGCTFHQGDCGGLLNTWQGPSQGIQLQLCDNHSNRLSPELRGFEVIDAAESESAPEEGATVSAPADS